MISLIDQWFDLFNTQQKFDNGTESYGLNLTDQNELIDKMSNFIMNMRVHKKQHLLPFQKGLILQYLFYDITYSSEYNINHNFLRNFDM